MLIKHVKMLLFCLCLQIKREFVEKFLLFAVKYLQFFQIKWYIMEINLHLEAYIR